MSGWTGAELDAVGGADELQIASYRADGTLRGFVTIWAVRVGDDVFVRSVYGSQNPWFRHAKASGRARIRAGGVERDVTLADAGADGADAVDAEYHRKYDRYGPRIVGTVVGEKAHAQTLRLTPSDAD